MPTGKQEVVLLVEKSVTLSLSERRTISPVAPSKGLFVTYLFTIIVEALYLLTWQRIYYPL